MKEKEETKLRTWHICVSFLVGVLWVLFIYILGIAKDEKIKNFDKGYKAGQIDFLNGIQKYDKVVQKDTVYLKIRK